jgi:hypothetical protein
MNEVGMVIVAMIIFLAGLATGYSLRAQISARRRKRYRLSVLGGRFKRRQCGYGRAHGSSTARGLLGGLCWSDWLAGRSHREEL